LPTVTSTLGLPSLLVTDEKHVQQVDGRAWAGVRPETGFATSLFRSPGPSFGESNHSYALSHTFNFDSQAGER